MTLNSHQRRIAIELLMEKADRNMEQAIKNADMQYWDLVANRLYYSIFHAVNALLLCDGIQTATHKGTSSIFGKNYVLTGEFLREDGILYSRLQTMREKADYQNVFTLSESQGNELIKEALSLKSKINIALNKRLSLIKE